MLLLVCFFGSGLILPYLTVIIRSLMPAFLPFISQAGGQPPSNGVFAIFMVVGSFCGIFAFGIFFESVHHRNAKNIKLIRICNNVGLVVIIISCLGLIVTIANPVGYTDVPNKFEWVTTVLFEHSIGATMILFGGAIYQYFLTAIWWYLPDTSRREKYIKLFFAVLYFIFFLIIVYPMPAFILEELGPRPFDLETMKKTTYDMPNVFSTSYKICAFCEWALCLLSLVNFLTHYKDLQQVSFHLVLRHRSCLAETVEPAPSLSLKVIK